MCAGQDKPVKKQKKQKAKGKKEKKEKADDEEAKQKKEEEKKLLKSAKKACDPCQLATTFYGHNTLCQALADASTKLKWAIGLLPSLSTMYCTYWNCSSITFSHFPKKLL